MPSHSSHMLTLSPAPGRARTREQGNQGTQEGSYITGTFHGLQKRSRSLTNVIVLIYALQAKNHGNEPSKGAKIDAEIQAEEEEILKKKGAWGSKK